MRSSSLPLVVLFALLFPTFSPAQIVVNEIMYVPNAPEPEWIELQNTADTAVPITGWTVQDRTTARPTIPAGTVPAQGYLVLTRDTAALRLARSSGHPFAAVQVSIPSLNNTGDDIILRDAAGATVDSVSWSSSWGGTGGVSLERITAGSASNERNSWQSATDTTGATPGNRNSVAPAVRDLRLRSLSFDPDTKEVRGTVVNAGVEYSVGATVSLYYDRNNDTVGDLQETQSGKNIPQIPPGDSVSFALRWNRPLTVSGEPALVFLDHPGDERPADNIGTLSVREKFVDTGVIVNEFIYAPSAPEPEWVELYNRGPFPVDLTGWVLHDAGAARPKLGPAILPAGSYLVITKDTAELREVRENASPLLQFPLPSLNNTGDNIVLRNRTGTVVDSISYKAAWGGSNGRSLERRLPGLAGNDSAAWGSSVDPAGGTPGKQNSLVPPNRNLALSSATFNGEEGSLSATVVNTGLTDASGGGLLLYRDENNNGVAEEAEVTAQHELPPISAQDSLTTTLPWPHPLTLGGEFGIILLKLSGDERPGDDTLRFIAQQPTVDTGLIVNEIMYDPNDPEPEWLELYNRGVAPVDLAGWRVGDGSGSSGPLPSTIILPGAYIVITPDTAALRSLRSVPSTVLRLLLPAFNNSGDGVLLRNPAGVAIDSFRYVSAWGGRNGTSLERKAFDLPSPDPATWTSTAAPSGGTPGAKNSWEPIRFDLAVGTVTFHPNTATVAAIVHNRGLENSAPAVVSLLFDANSNGTLGPGEELQRTSLPGLSPSDSATVTLPWPRPLTVEGEEGTIEVLFADDQRPENNSRTFRAIPPAVDTGVVVNEVMYNPNSPEPEWLELYNRGVLPVQLKGWKIQDGSTSSAELPEFWLAPGEYLVITGDSAELRHLREIHAPVVQLLHPAFNNGGDRVLLSNPSGQSVDQFTYTAAWGGVGGNSLERKNPEVPADDSLNWKTSSDPTGATPGKENSTPLPEKNIALHTVVFDPAVSRVSIVVVNTGTEPATEGEVILYYDGNRDGTATAGEELARKELPEILPLDSTTIVLLWPRPLTPQGEPGILSLSMEGDRNPGDNTGRFLARTPLADTGIVVNECMYAPAAPEPEWIELFNAGTLPVDLTGWSVGDAASARTIPGAIVDPGAYLVLTADTVALRSAREISSSVLQLSLPTLNNSEDAVVLRNSSGARIDSLYYSQSWGGNGGRSLERRRTTDRATDSASWRTSVDSTGATPGRANSVLPPARNLTLDSVGFSKAAGTVIAWVGNGGNKKITGAEVTLYFDRNEDGRGESGEEIARTTLPPLLPDSTFRSELVWPRLLTDEGETALAQVTAEGDLVEGDNRQSLLLQRPPLDTGLIISEVMFDPLPLGELAGAEYIEVYNPNNRPVPLAGWRVADGSGKEKIIAEEAPHVHPGAFAVIAADSTIYFRFPFLADSTNVAVLGTDLGLNNTEDDVILRNPLGVVADSLHYSDAWHWSGLDDTKGIALERLSFAGPGTDPRNWSSSVAVPGGTPGGPNSRTVPVAAAAAELAAEPPRISPDGDGFEDFTRISYRLPFNAARVVLSIYDRHGRRVARPLNNAPSATEGSFIWDGADQEGNPLPMGIYILRMEIYAADSSETKSAQTVITVARRL